MASAGSSHPTHRCKSSSFVFYGYGSLRLLQKCICSSLWCARTQIVLKDFSAMTASQTNRRARLRTAITLFVETSTETWSDICRGATNRRTTSGLLRKLCPQSVLYRAGVKTFLPQTSGKQAETKDGKDCFFLKFPKARKGKWVNQKIELAPYGLCKLFY